jgi:hypothetical protein
MRAIDDAPAEPRRHVGSGAVGNDGYQDEINARENGESERRITPSWRGGGYRQANRGSECIEKKG